MRKNFLTNFTVFDYIILSSVLILFVFFYAGFYFISPMLKSSRSYLALILLWGIRIILPALFIFFVIIYYKVRMRKILIKEILFLFIISLIIVFLSYPFLNFFYNKFYRSKYLDVYHPYLQLMPNDFPLESKLTDKGFTVVCLGGSTTEFRDSFNKDWPLYVEENIKRTTGRKNINFINQGRQWYTTLHSLINYQENLQRHKIDMLIIMHAINDLLHNADFSFFSKGNFRNDYGHFLGPLVRLLNQKTIEQFLWAKFKQYWYYPEQKVIETDSFPGEESFRRNINTIIELAKLKNTKVILMTQPSLYSKNVSDEIKSHLHMLNTEAVGEYFKWSYRTAYNGFIRYNTVIREISKQRDVYFIDLDKKVPKTLEYFNDDVHYTDKGFKLISEEISKAILDFKLF